MNVSHACVERTDELLSRVPEGGVVIELGALRGHMALYGKAKRPDIHWIMVDNWWHKDLQPKRYLETGDLNAQHDIEAITKIRLEAYANAGEAGACVLKMESAFASTILRDGVADVVFLDADHSYYGVAEDIEFWVDIVAEGGWLGGHDYGSGNPGFAGVDQAVTEFVEYTGREIVAGANQTWWVQL